ASARRSRAVRRLLPCAGAAGAPRLADARRALVRVCRAVGGLPLAIEMAASALRAVPPADLAARLEEEPYRLGSASVDAPERHRSLARVVAASWRALPPRARTAAARLGVFRGGFTLRAAADVAGVGRGDLSDLIDHGWLVLSPAGRYSLHPHLAAAAARRPERRPEALRALRERHARWYLDLVRQAAPATTPRSPRPGWRWAACGSAASPRGRPVRPSSGGASWRRAWETTGRCRGPSRDWPWSRSATTATWSALVTTWRPPSRPPCAPATRAT